MSKQSTRPQQPLSDSKKQLLSDGELSKWANSFRVRRDSAKYDPNELIPQRKTVQTFSKPKSSLEIDAD